MPAPPSPRGFVGPAQALLAVAAASVTSLLLLLTARYSHSSSTPFARFWSTSSSSVSAASCAHPTSLQLIGKYGELPVKAKETLLHCENRLRSPPQEALFQQGILLLYGFNYDEARLNFQAAIDTTSNSSSSSSCPFCRFGLLYSHGPNLNRVIDASDVEAAARIVLDSSLDDLECPLERSLVTAQKEHLFHRQKWNTTGRRDYADALHRLAFNNEEFALSAPLLQTFWAEAVLNTQPWHYFSRGIQDAKDAREEDTATTYLSDPPMTQSLRLLPEIQPAFDTLQRLILQDGFHHSLALHLYIHITEQSSTPQDGLVAADALAAVMQSSGTGHLVHMPGHAYMRCGQYDKCIRAGLGAINVDEVYTRNCVAPYAAAHNQALVMVAAMSLGQMDVALRYAPSVLRSSDDTATYLSALFHTPRELVLARFGRFQEILDLQTREEEEASAAAAGGIGDAGSSHWKEAKDAIVDRELPASKTGIPVTKIMSARPAYMRALRLYPRALAHIHSSQTDAADTTHAALLARATAAAAELSATVALIPEDTLPRSHVFFPYHRELGLLMNATVFAAAAVKQGRFSAAALVLRDAVHVQDNFHYMEPENFYLPLRQCLAAVLIAEADKHIAAAGTPGATTSCQALLENASLVLQQDLSEHPHNVWAQRGVAMLRRRTKADNLDVPSPCCEVAFC